MNVCTFQTRFDIVHADRSGNSQSRDNNVDNKKKTKGTIRDEHYTNHIPEKIDYKAAIEQEIISSYLIIINYLL